MRRLLPLSFAGLLACQSTDASSDVVLALDRIDERLTSIETRLEGYEAEAEARAKRSVERAELQATVDKLEAEAARREAEREAARARVLTRRVQPHPEDSDDPLAGLGGSDGKLEGAAEGIQCTEPTSDRTECKVDRAFLEHLLGKPSALVRQARIVPHVKNGQVAGFKMFGIRRGSVPKLLGFQNGDTLRSINGNELETVDQAMQAYEDVRRKDEFVIEFERRGASNTLAMEIVE